MSESEEYFDELYICCRQLLRYDGIDPERVRQAVDCIRDIVRRYDDERQHPPLD